MATQLLKTSEGKEITPSLLLALLFFSTVERKTAPTARVSSPLDTSVEMKGLVVPALTCSAVAAIMMTTVNVKKQTNLLRFVIVQITLMSLATQW